MNDPRPGGWAGRSPTGTQYRIGSGDYAAVVTGIGATLRSLTLRGRDLISGFAEDEPVPAFNGAVLAPWPNRLGDGRYSFGGESHQVPISEPERATALHGFVAGQEWSALGSTDDAVHLATTIVPQRGYPFPIELQAVHRVSMHGLAIDLTAHNPTGTDAPFGFGLHPWFTAATGSVDDWRLQLPSGRVLETDDRLLPVREVAATGALDFSAGARIGDTALDHTFTRLTPGPDGGFTASLTARDGSGLQLWWSATAPFVQVCTGDRAPEPLARRAVAIEPMTCPPDAFRREAPVLAAGESLTLTMTVAAVGPGGP